MPNKIKITERKLGKEKAFGLWWGRGKIEIDSRLRGKSRMRTIVHELLHESFPDLSERKIIRAEKIISEGLWIDNYRKVDQ